MPTLEFKGKQHIYAHHLSVPYRPLVPDLDKSASTASFTPPPPPPIIRSDSGLTPDDNLIIHGDNLHALKALLPRYAGRVKCIYIDPPYNTGNEGWVYNDRVNSPLMRAWLDDNSPIDGEDLERHDKWLCMMWPRLQILRELLSDDGAIFVSIDDNEQHHLRMMMDEVFGEGNFLATIVWQHRSGRSNNARLFSNQREFAIVYRKSPQVEFIRIPRDSDLNLTYSNPDGDPRGPWASSSYVNPATAEERPRLVYPIYNPITERYVNHPTHAWKYSLETHQEHVCEDKLWWGVNGRMRYPRLKNFLYESIKKGIVPIDLVLASVGGTTDEGTRTLQDVSEGSIAFSNPKPVTLVSKMIEISEGIWGSDKNSIILDSFAGSGTTAHAVLALNKEDGGNRKFILVECEEYADTITAERVRRVINGVPNARDKNLREGLGGSFTYCELGDPIDAESMLSGESLPDYPTLASYLLHTATGASANGAPLDAPNADGLFHRDDATDYYLIYEPDSEWLRSGAAMLNSDRAKRIAAVNERDGKRAVVFGPGKYIGQRELTRMGIAFSQIPYEIHRAG